MSRESWLSRSSRSATPIGIIQRHVGNFRVTSPVTGAISPHPPLSLKARSFLLHLDRDFEEAVEGIRGVLPLARILERRHAVHLVDATTRRVRPSLVQLRGTRDPPTRPPPERASVLWGTVLLNHAPTGLTHDKTPHTPNSPIPLKPRKVAQKAAPVRRQVPPVSHSACHRNTTSHAFGIRARQKITQQSNPPVECSVFARSASDYGSP